MLFQSFALFAATAQAALTYKGVDWSSLLVEEAAGKSYAIASGAKKPLENVFAAYGVNTVRQRIWVNPANGDYDLDYNLKLAKRAKAAGLGVYLDFHYSDIWADPGHQGTPAAWANYDIDDLAYKVYNYTKDTMNSFQEAGVPLSLVSIGNEIRNGLLWPLGNLSAPNGPHNVARLLHSASSGIKDSSMSPQPKIMIHLDDGWDYSIQEYWYDTVLGQGPLSKSDFDIQGVSYYPFYNSEATLEALNSSLRQMSSKYGKDVMVVETDWPTECSDPEYAFPADAKDIPFSAAGQTTWMKDVAAVVASAGGNGLFYWEPAWIDNAGLGSSCENNLMFDSSGKALSSMSVFKSI